MKKINLTQGKVALVDDEDFDWLNKYKWYANESGNTYYAMRVITIQSQNKNKNIKRKRKRILMHVETLKHKLERELKPHKETDHINNNGLDNRKCNLREVNSSQNKMNRKKQNKKTSSIYKGIYWYKNKKKWHVRIMLNRKSICLGYFDDEKEAAITYDKAALKYFGEFARLNFS